MKSRARKGRRRLRIVLAWCVAVIWAFPLLYMLLTSFKTEADAVPPTLWIAHPTLQNYGIVLQHQILRYLEDSAIISVSTVALCILVGVPTSYVIVFGRLKKADNLFFWFLSTTLLPPVAVIIPVFLIFRVLGLLDTLGGMILIFSGVNIPIVIWMIRAFLLDVPREILESADLDGASRLRSFFSTIVPLCRQGIVSIALLVFIFVWNEFFFSINLTYVNAAPVPVYMASFMTQEGLFWAKLSAISTLVILPPSILGWFAQRSLVKGLTAGSVKG
jgi:sorbitol/mannitol transport system permease protein